MSKQEAKEASKERVSEQRSTPSDLMAMIEWLEIPYENLANVATVDIFVAITWKLKELSEKVEQWPETQSKPQ